MIYPDCEIYFTKLVTLLLHLHLDLELLVNVAIVLIHITSPLRPSTPPVMTTAHYAVRYSMPLQKYMQECQVTGHYYSRNTAGRSYVSDNMLADILCGQR